MEYIQQLKMVQSKIGVIYIIVKGGIRKALIE